MSSEEIATSLGRSVPQVRFDLWYAVTTGTPGERRPNSNAAWYRLAAREGNLCFDGQSWAVAATIHAYSDLARGKPCMLGLPRAEARNMAERCLEILPKEDGNHPYPDGDRRPYEVHSCAPDAFAWLTSVEFLEWCDSIEWQWEALVRMALAAAEEVRQKFPFVPLEPSWVWRTALATERRKGLPSSDAMYAAYRRLERTVPLGPPVA